MALSACLDFGRQIVVWRLLCTAAAVPREVLWTKGQKVPRKSRIAELFFPACFETLQQSSFSSQSFPDFSLSNSFTSITSDVFSLVQLSEVSMFETPVLGAIHFPFLSGQYYFAASSQSITCPSKSILSLVFQPLLSLASADGSLLSLLHQQFPFLSLSSQADTCLQAFIDFIFLYK